MNIIYLIPFSRPIFSWNVIVTIICYGAYTIVYFILHKFYASKAKNIQAIINTNSIKVDNNRT